MRRDVTFLSQGLHCAGWLYLPDDLQSLIRWKLEQILEFRSGDIAASEAKTLDDTQRVFKLLEAKRHYDAAALALKNLTENFPKMQEKYNK